MDLPPSSSWGTRTQTITIQGSTNGTTYTPLVASAGYTFTARRAHRNGHLPRRHRPVRPADLHRQHRMARRPAIRTRGLSPAPRAAYSPGSALTATPMNLALASTTVGSTSGAQTVTVSNPNARHLVSSASASGPFSQTDTCGTSIAANGRAPSASVRAHLAGAASGSLSAGQQRHRQPADAGAVRHRHRLFHHQPGPGPAGHREQRLRDLRAVGNVTDGNTSTYWESNDGAGYPQTITVDLGSAQSVGSVTLDLPPSSAWSTRTETLSVLDSGNGSSFSQLVAVGRVHLQPLCRQYGHDQPAVGDQYPLRAAELHRQHRLGRRPALRIPDGRP